MIYMNDIQDEISTDKVFRPASSETSGCETPQRSRVALLVADSAHLSPLEFRLAEKLSGDDSIDLVAIISVPNNRRQKDLPPGFFTRLNRIIFNLAMKVEKSILGIKSSYNIPENLRSTTVFFDISQGCANKRKRADDLNQFKLDLIINGCPDFFEDQALTISHYGVWSIRYTARNSRESGPAGFWTSQDKSRLAGLTVIMRSNGDLHNRTVCEVHYNTKGSTAITADYLAEKAASLVHNQAAKFLQKANSDTANFSSYQEVPCKFPTLLQLAQYGVYSSFHMSARLFRKVLEKMRLRPYMWTLCFGQGDWSQAKLNNLDEFAPSGNRYWADPFVIIHDNQNYVFFEDYDYSRKIGSISVGQFKAGSFRYIGNALTAGYHLSFPFVFRHGGEIFMMPETHEKKRLEIWRATDFPLGWELHATAFEGQLVADAVLFQREGQWWLFCGLCDGAFTDFSGELFLFSVDGPGLKDIKPHKNNPVSTGSAHSRNGGRVFMKDGRLFRVSQNNSHGVYGYGLNIMEITSLSDEFYEERLHQAILPDFKKGAAGIHHMDFCDDFFVVDVCKRYGGFAKSAK